MDENHPLNRVLIPRKITIYKSLVTQAHHVRKVIKAFGRHPHRNQILGRKSTPAEEAYVAEGNFPHERAFR